MDLTKLAEPFDPTDIEWRVQRNGETNGKKWAMVLAYINNRAIMDRLDEVCGPGGWKNHFKEWHGNSQLCGISINIPAEKDSFGHTIRKEQWLTKWDGADATNIEATKGGLSDAMKRAGYQWGIGRYLYKLDNTFVNLLDGRGKDPDHITVGIKEGERSVNYHYKRPALPDFAMPKGVK